jgi:ABC-type lipoprotein release transport system permease subunit
MDGWMLGTIKEQLDTDIAHIQIHNPKFAANHEIQEYFTAPPNLPKGEELSPFLGGLRGASRRLVLSGMLASANNAVGIMAKAVHTDEEKAVSSVWQTIPDTLGAFLPDDAKMPIVISKKTADKLKVRLKSKIVFTFQDANEEMQSVAFRVCGIYHTSNTVFDEGTMFVRYDDIFPLTALPDGAIHEIAIHAGDLETCDLVYPEIKAALPELEVQSWKEIQPILEWSWEWTDLFGFIIIGIFLLALAFGIVNTMLMAVLERTRELGMLGAIGMSKGKIFRMIMLETLFLTVLGSIAGVILATVVLIPSLSSGIDLTFMMGDTFEDYGYSSIVYPVINLTMFVEIAIMVFVAGIISAIYPAVKALKLKPLEAIRE